MVELPVGGLQTTGDRVWRYSGYSVHPCLVHGECWTGMRGMMGAIEMLSTFIVSI